MQQQIDCGLTFGVNHIYKKKGSNQHSPLIAAFVLPPPNLEFYNIPLRFLSRHTNRQDPLLDRRNHPP